MGYIRDRGQTLIVFVLGVSSCLSASLVSGGVVGESWLGVFSVSELVVLGLVLVSVGLMGLEFHDRLDEL